MTDVSRYAADDDRQLVELERFSARIGSDPSVIQGAGGNTSLKLRAGDGRTLLHVKASGLWLSQCGKQPCFVALDLSALRHRIDTAAEEPDLADLVLHAPASSLRPSIETVLHAVMPHAVVVHTHSVNAIAHLIRRDALAQLAERLAGLRWAFVPYARPGLPLLHAVNAARGTEADVLMLQNHGLVLGADSVAAAEALHDELERRLALPARSAPAPDLDRLRAHAIGTGWRPANLAASHALATDAASRRLAGLGAFYPDHVVFLGPGGLPNVPAKDLAAAIHAARTAAPPGKALLVEDLGVLVPEGLNAGAEEMLRCLALVLARGNLDGEFLTLDRRAEAALIGWDAELHRQRLDPGPSP